MDQFVAEPVVAAWVTKTDFVLRPRTIEEAGPVVLLDQQRRAVDYRTTGLMCEKYECMEVVNSGVCCDLM